MEKATSRSSTMYGHGKSDGCIVPGTWQNKDEPKRSSADANEGRRPMEGNANRSAVPWTQSQISASPGLLRVREVARHDKKAQFTALLHHVTVDLLRDSFYALKKHAAPGVDGVTWQSYEIGLEDRLRRLHEKVHLGTYRAQPSRRTYIPKADGKKRPLGVATLEDKVVQHATVAVLNAVYETDFQGFSYGFRPGRSQHDALDALWVGITHRKVSWVLDADIRGFFDTINHEWMLKFLGHRIADPRMLRLIAKWLRAGVSEDGVWAKTEIGTPQGAVISPLLANVYLHYVFDLWVKLWRSKYAFGEVLAVRYADDFVMGFQHRHEAERFLNELQGRLAQFGLALHPEKTRLIEFGRFAAENRRRRGEGKPETFNFMGFTHHCSRTHLKGVFVVARRTMAKRLRAKLREVKETLMRLRHLPLWKLRHWLSAVVRGYMNYHAVPGNHESVAVFRTQVIRYWYKALKRRSQRAKITWERFGPLANSWLPKTRILHPHPDVRFYAKHPT